MVEISWVQLPCHVEKTLSHRRHAGLLIPTFCALFCNRPWALGLGAVLEMNQLWMNTPWPTVLCFVTSCRFLQWSLSAEIEAFCWGMRAAFTPTNEHVECVTQAGPEGWMWPVYFL